MEVLHDRWRCSPPLCLSSLPGRLGQSFNSRGAICSALLDRAGPPRCLSATREQMRAPSPLPSSITHRHHLHSVPLAPASGCCLLRHKSPGSRRPLCMAAANLAVDPAQRASAAARVSSPAPWPSGLCKQHKVSSFGSQQVSDRKSVNLFVYWSGATELHCVLARTSTGIVVGSPARRRSAGCSSKVV